MKTTSRPSLCTPQPILTSVSAAVLTAMSSNSLWTKSRKPMDRRSKSWSAYFTPMTSFRTPPEEKKTTTIVTASAVLPGGELVEMVYDPIDRKTQFVCGNGEAWRYEESVSLSPTERLV